MKPRHVFAGLLALFFALPLGSQSTATKSETLEWIVRNLKVQTDETYFHVGAEFRVRNEVDADLTKTGNLRVTVTERKNDTEFRVKPLRTQTTMTMSVDKIRSGTRICTSLEAGRDKADPTKYLVVPTADGTVTEETRWFDGTPDSRFQNQRLTIPIGNVELGRRLLNAFEHLAALNGSNEPF